MNCHLRARSLTRSLDLPITARSIANSRASAVQSILLNCSSARMMTYDRTTPSSFSVAPSHTAALPLVTGPLPLPTNWRYNIYGIQLLVPALHRTRLLSRRSPSANRRNRRSLPPSVPRRVRTSALSCLPMPTRCAVWTSCFRVMR